jgi:hypothetical protein
MKRHHHHRACQTSALPAGVDFIEPWLNPDSGLCDELGKQSNVQPERLCELGDLVEPHDEVLRAKPQEVPSRERVFFRVTWYSASDRMISSWSSI